MSDPALDSHMFALERELAGRGRTCPTHNKEKRKSFIVASAEVLATAFEGTVLLLLLHDHNCFSASARI